MKQQTKSKVVEKKIAPNGSRGIQSIEIGFKILDFLRQTTKPVPLKAIAVGVNMKPTNVRYYLVSFVSVGIVRQDSDTGYYGLGPYALKLGVAALEQFDLFTTARPIMAELASKVGYTAFLAVWGNRGPTIVYRIEGSDNLPILELKIGSVLPLFRSAVGRNFFAHLPRDLTKNIMEQELKEIKKINSSLVSKNIPKTIKEAEEMAKIIRENGVSKSSNGLIQHYSSLSAPIFDHTGFMVGAITIMGSVGQLDDSLDGKTVKFLKAYTNQISDALGYHSDLLL